MNKICENSKTKKDAQLQSSLTFWHEITGLHFPHCMFSASELEENVYLICKLSREILDYGKKLKKPLLVGAQKTQMTLVR